jgi:hypothetical protein
MCTTRFVDSGVIVPNFLFHSCPLLVVHTSCALLRWTISHFLCPFLLWTDITRIFGSWCVLLWCCFSSGSYSIMWGVYLFCDCYLLLLLCVLKVKGKQNLVNDEHNGTLSYHILKLLYATLKKDCSAVVVVFWYVKQLYISYAVFLCFDVFLLNWSPVLYRFRCFILS